MPRPQSIVAVILAIVVLFGFVLAGLLRWWGYEPAPEEVELWLALMGTLVGGLIAYIGTGRGRGD